jgi:hypothetical protein
MKAQLKSGKQITGKLAETFSRLGIASEISEKAKPGRKKKVVEESEEKE